MVGVVGSNPIVPTKIPKQQRFETSAVFLSGNGFKGRKAACTIENIVDENCNDTALARLDVLLVRLAARRLVSFLF